MGQFRLDMASSCTHNIPMSNPSLLEIDRGTLQSPSWISAQHAGEDRSIKHLLFQVHGILLTICFTVLIPFGVGIIRSGKRSIQIALDLPMDRDRKVFGWDAYCGDY